MDSINIIIIEDEALIAENIRQQLEDFGYGVAGVYYRFDTARNALTKGNFDLVITDIDIGNGIAERSGIVLMKFLRSLKKCPIIFLTAHGDRDTIARAAALNPSAYLVKPVNATNLYATIQVAVENFNSTKTASLSSSAPEVPDHFFVKLGHTLVKLEWSDVFSMMAVKNYVLLKTLEHPSGLPVRSSLQHVLQSMVPRDLRDSFIRINRSEVIARRIIKKITATTIETTQGVFSYTGELNGVK